MNKIIVTVTGEDQVGIIGKVCTYLSDQNINILDISQSVTSGFFNMLVIADMSGASLSFDDAQEGLKKLGEELGFEIRTQREEIFTAMHRI